MKALVTGGTGFIGGHLCRVLVDAGDQVTCLVRPSSNRTTLAAMGVDFVVGDVTRPDSLSAALAGVDVVYHLAAMLAEPWHPDFVRTNADGVGNMAAACAALPRPPRLVLVSSIAAAGPSRDRPLTEDDSPGPVSQYGRSKLGGEQAARVHAAKVPITVVRPPIVLGEGDTALLPAFQLASRGFYVAPTQGDVSLIHVVDLARLCRRAAEAGETLAPEPAGSRRGQGIYFGGAEVSPSVAALGPLIGAAVGRSVRVVRTPAALSYLAGALGEAMQRLGRGTGGKMSGLAMMSRDKIREATAGSWVCSTAKAKTQLGWTPAATLPERLAQTAAWYRAEGLI